MRTLSRLALLVSIAMPTFATASTAEDAATVARRIPGIARKVSGQLPVGRRAARMPCKSRIAKAFKRLGRKIKRRLKKAGRAIKRGFKKAGRAIKKGFKKAGRAIKKLARRVRRSAKKTARKIRRAFSKRRGKRTRKVIAKSKPQGLAALLGKRPATRPRPRGRSMPSSFRGAVHGLGNLVPILAIVQKIQSRVKQGVELPGDPWFLEYQRWQEQIRDKEIDAKTPAPGELTEEEKKLFQERYVKRLLPDLKDYVLFIFDKVFVKGGKPPAIDDAVDALFKYGCKRISRLMPGFAKVVQKRISYEVGLVGDWDQEIPPAALEKPAKKGKAAGAAPPYKPKRVEVVEICTVTHRQLEETLRQDLRKIVSAVQPGRSVTSDDDLIRPVSAGIRTKSARHPAVRRAPARRTPVARRPTRATRRPAPRRRVSKRTRRRRRSAQAAAQARRVTAADQQRLTTRRRGEERLAKLSAAEKERRWAAAQAKLWVNLDKYDPELKGESFHDIAKRLLSFYRKAGGVRNFTRAMTESGKEIAKLARKDDLPPAAQTEMAHQASETTVSTRNRRELLRRKVDQWTYGYEYEQLGDFLRVPTHKRLLGDYQQAEATVLERFWDDCDELQAICQGPRTRGEKEACTRCAEETLRSHCIDGTKTEGGKRTCQGGYKIRFFDPNKVGVGRVSKRIMKGNLKRKGKKRKKKKKSTKGKKKTTGGTDASDNEVWNTELTVGPKGNLGPTTFLNWLALQVIDESHDTRFHRGNGVTDLSHFRASVIENLIDRLFLPNEKASSREGVSTEGKQKFDALPITAWQRCVLWNPYHGSGPGQSPDLCDWAKGDMKALKDKLKGTIQWEQARVFKLALAHPEADHWLKSANNFWKQECSRKVKRKWNWGRARFKKVARVNCSKLDRRARKQAAKFFAREGESKSGMGAKKRLGKAGKAISAAAGPLIGKLLGMLLKAAGLYEAMKTLARAAGMTPEQSADCEDAEYRKDVMKLPPKQDHKRGCLLRVFAKNFTTMLESIIVMLGNKLVDWGVDMLRTALQGVKTAILSAAASVPFAGGFLAALVDIGWELIINYGLKALLKGFVVANLPKWLKIHELSKLPIEKVMEHPIVQVVVGVILQLIDAAMTYGEKSWMAVGMDSIVNTIQVLLQNGKNWFWVRALTYAKKELRKNPPSGDGIVDQLLHLARAMIGGFGAAVSRRLDADTRDPFDAAVDEIKALLTKERLSQLRNEFLKSPIKALIKLIGEKIGPVVMPVVAALVPMPVWAKSMLSRVGVSLSEQLKEIREKSFDPKKLVGRIVHVFEPVGEWLLGKLPINDEALKEMVLKGYRGIIFALKNIDKIRTEYLGKPWNIVSALVNLAGDYLTRKVAGLITDPKLAPERQLVADVLGLIIRVLSDAKIRDKLFPGGRPEVRAILAEVANTLKPYAVARMQGLVAGTGLEKLVGDAVGFFLGPNGPLAQGERFFTNLGGLLASNAAKITSRVLGAISAIVKRPMGGGRVVGALVEGLVGAIGKALGSPGGLKAAFRGGVASLVKFLKDAAEPLLKVIAPEGLKIAGAPITKLLHNGLTGLLNLLANAKTLSTLSLKDLTLVTRSVRDTAPVLLDLLRQAAGTSAIGKFFQRVFEGLQQLLSSPANLKAFLSKPASAIFAILVREAAEPLGKLVSDAVRDPALKALARDGLKAAMEFVSRALAGGGTNLGQAAREIIAKLVPTVVNLAKEKLGGLFPYRLRTFRDVVATGLDTVGSFVAELIAKGKAAWQKLLAGGGQILGKLVKAFLPMIKAPIIKAVSYKPVQGLLTRLLDSVANLLADPAALVRSFRDSKAAMKKLLPELGKILGPFAHDVLVKPLARGIPRDIVAAIVTAGVGFLEKPETFQSFLQKIKGDAKGLLREVVKGLAPALVKSLPSKALRKVFEAGLKAMADTVAK